MRGAARRAGSNKHSSAHVIVSMVDYVIAKALAVRPWEKLKLLCRFAKSKTRMGNSVIRISEKAPYNIKKGALK